jgi:hypothetical protein
MLEKKRRDVLFITDLSDYVLISDGLILSLGKTSILYH